MGSFDMLRSARAAPVWAGLVLLLGAPPARAACPLSGVQLFPAPGARVPTNARFLLEGLGDDQGKVSALVGSTLQLKSSTDAIPVQVQRGYRSSMRRVSVWLKPTRDLKAGAEYRLMLGRSLAGVTVVNAGAHGLAWRAGDGADKHKPTWREVPSVSEGEYSLMEGALSRRVKLHVEAEDESPVFLVFTAWRKHGPAGKQNYFAPVDGDEAALGHDGCNGSFIFEDGGAYHAKVQLFDAAGNPGPSAEVEFLSPAPQ